MNLYEGKRTGLVGILVILCTVSLTVFLASCDDDDAPLAISSFDFEASGDLEFGIPLNVQFIDKSTSTNVKTTYAWDFGDGTTSTEKNPFHTYEKGGSYTVKLALTNADGKKNESTEEIELSSPLVGTWKLDSTALSTIDSFAAKGIVTALEYGNENGWDGKKWTSVSDDGSQGYVPFWSNVIFAGDYYGRKSFFAVEYTFTAEGKFIREIKNDLPGIVHFAPEKESYSLIEDWKNGDGVSLDAWKSGEFDWTMKSSNEFAGRSEIVIGGKNGGYLGIYFAGSELTVPDEEYVYTVALVNDNQLIVSAASNLNFGYPPVFVLKLKKFSE